MPRADGTAKIFTLPDVSGLSNDLFPGAEVGGLERESWWDRISTGSRPSRKRSTGRKSNWWMTPTARYADFTAISQLPKVKLKVTDRT